MSWGADELHHRSAERSGWCAELRAADPEDVDETVSGAVDYAAETHSGAADDPEVEREHAGPPDHDTADAEGGPSEQGGMGGFTCEFCGDEVPAGEALDAAGAPQVGGFEWLGSTAAYHRECIPAGNGRFLPWTASGLLSDDPPA